MNTIFLLIGMTASSLGLATTADRNSIESLKNIIEVSNLLIGTVDSSEQAGSNRNYQDVTIETCPVIIRDLPGYETNSKFLYVDQSLTLWQGSPYRQRFVKISAGRDGKTINSTIYLPKIEKSQLVGLCRKSISERVFLYDAIGTPSCLVNMRKLGKSWIGSTPANGCPSTRGSAKYTTSELVLNETGLISWDRGWNQDGKQVWGAVEGPYVFKKVDAVKHDIHVNAVARRLTGQFNNFKQADEDPENYLPLSYNNCSVKLINSNFPPNSRVIAIEQNANTDTVNFNKLRVLVVTKPGGEFSHYDAKTSTWEIEDKEKYRGLCSEPAEERIADANDMIIEKCPLYFKINSERNYIGETPGGGCKSEYRGASRL